MLIAGFIYPLNLHSVSYYLRYSQNLLVYPPTLSHRISIVPLRLTQHSAGLIMLYSLDWLSFTVPFEPIARGSSHLLGPLVEQAVTNYLGELTDELLGGQSFTLGYGRRPYAASWGREDGGVRFFGSSKMSHVLVEISGIGCKTLRAQDKIAPLLALVHERVSRADLAVDIETTCRPLDFVVQRTVKRFKAEGYIKSDTGETAYVGGLSSDRFARVYRYDYPHPRWQSLRVEHVFRRRQAQAFTKALLENNYAGAVVSAGKVFGWSHPEWDTGEISPISITAVPLKKTQSNTINWLYGSVVSSIVKSVNAGDLDLNDWLSYLEDKLKCTNAVA